MKSCVVGTLGWQRLACSATRVHLSPPMFVPVWLRTAVSTAPNAAPPRSRPVGVSPPLGAATQQKKVFKVAREHKRHDRSNKCLHTEHSY
jgi:hypothetical protein